MADDRLPEAARAFAEGDVELLPAALDEAAAEALVALLVERGDAARLARLGESSDKALGKRARKALHLLRTRGVAAPKSQKREFRPHGPYGAAEDVSLASMIDGRGERIVWLVREVERGYDVFEAQLSDTRGILGFSSAHAPRRDWRAHLAKVVADERLAVGRVSERHARALIEDGYKRTLELGRVPPEEFARARLGMGHYEPEERHPALDAAPPFVVADVRGRLGALHELHELGTWIPPEDSLPALDLEIGNIATSKLVVGAAGRQEQLAAAVERIAGTTLTPEYRKLLGTRLYETALLLAARGKLDEARLTTTAAELTLDDKVPAGDNPFVLRLFNKVVKAPELEPPAP
jgi:hypothetical protein